MWDRFEREGVVWYYRSLVDAFTARAPGPMADELNSVVCELEELVTQQRP